MGSIENLMRNPNSRSTMHVRPIEDRSFYPKIKQKFNQNISPDFSDYNPNSGTGNVIYIQTRKRNPKQNIRSNISSYNNTLSSSTGSVDLRSFDSPVKNSQIHLENRIEKAFYPKSLDSANAVTVSPFLISSIALPKVNGQIVSSRSFPHRSIARKARSLPILLPGILGGSSIEVIKHPKENGAIIYRYHVYHYFSLILKKYFILFWFIDDLEGNGIANK